jgi:3-methyl-2-oxobutanoate hydroxymethyltransferase
VLIECVPADIGQQITEAVSVPTIGIGAGRHTTGQVLVTHDMLGMTAGYLPKFVREFADLRSNIRDAATAYADAIKDGTFPGKSQMFE